MRAILLWCSVMMFFSCKNTPMQYDLPADMKAYFNYPIGTYWIYRDSTTGQNDSFVVVDYNDSHYGPYSDNNAVNEEVSIGIARYDSSTNYTGYGILLSTESGRNYSGLTFPNNYRPLNGYFSEGFPFILSSPYSNVQKSILPSVTINNKTYFDCYRYRVSYDDQHFTEILINRDSGIIKMNFNNDSVHEILELANCHRLQ